MKSSKPAVAIIPQLNQVLIGTSQERQLYSYFDSQLSEILLNTQTVKVFADAVEGQKLLQQNGLEVKGQVFDVPLADSLLTAGLEIDNSIDSIGQRYLGKSLSEPTPQDLLLLRENLREKLIEEKLVDVALVEFNATKATAQMSRNGVRLDTAWLKDKQQELQEERRGLESQVKGWLGEKLPDETDKIQLSDLTSTKKTDKTQTLEWFNRAGVPLESFNKNHIQSLTTEHPILNQFQRMRTVSDLIGNKGIQGLLNVVDDENKVYPTWHQNSAATGRMSATKPAIQNIPASLKRSIIPEQQGEERQVFVRGDYSQQELRILAQLTGDKTLTSAYQEGRDAHRLTASLMTGKPENKITSEERQRAKPVNFGKIYGQSPQGLQSYAIASYGVEFSIEDAMKFQAAMDKGYPEVARHEQQVRQNFKQQWNAALSSEDNQYPQTRTLLGRKREWQPQPDQYPPINKALGLPEVGKVQVLPNIREFNQSQKSTNLTPRVATEEDLKRSQQRLLSADAKHHSLQQKALNYLESRGITPEMAQRYNIGLNFGFRTPDGRSLPASITFHHRDAVEPDKLYLRRRYAPWLSENELEPGTPKWGQSGVPPSVWVVQQPEQNVEKTYLTEGPWDAVRLGEAVRQSGESIAVACTSTGARGIPPPEQLRAIPGEEVVIFYVCEAW